MANKHIPPPPPEEEVFAGHIPPPPAETEAFSTPNPEEFAVHTGASDTLHVPADKFPQAVGEVKQQLKDVGAAVAPFAIPAVMTATMGPAGLVARTGMNLLGGAAGEAARQIIKPEATSAGAAKKIGTSAAVQAGVGLAAEAGVAGTKLLVKTIASVGREAVDFFGRLVRGTTKTAGEVPSAELAKPLPSVDEIKGYGQSIADTLKEKTNELGAHVAKAIRTVDSRSKEGAVPVAKVNQMIENFAAERGVYKTIAGPNQALRKPLESAMEKLAAVNPTKDPAAKLSYSQLDNLIKEIEEATSFDPTNFGDDKAAAAAKRQLQGLTGRLRESFPPSIKKAKAALANLADVSTTITNELSVLRGQKVGLSDVSDISKKLVKLIRQNSVEATALDEALKAIEDGKDLLKKGRGLAVRQQLRGEPSADAPGASGMVTRAIQSVTAPTARTATPFAAKVLALTEKAGSAIPGGEEIKQLPNIVRAVVEARQKRGQ